VTSASLIAATPPPGTLAWSSGPSASMLPVLASARLSAPPVRAGDSLPVIRCDIPPASGQIPHGYRHGARMLQYRESSPTHGTYSIESVVMLRNSNEISEVADSAGGQRGNRDASGCYRPAGTGCGTVPVVEGSPLRGRLTVNTAPPSGWLPASMCPPCNCAFSEAIARPRPLPSERARAVSAL